MEGVAATLATLAMLIGGACAVLLGIYVVMGLLIFVIWPLALVGLAIFAVWVASFGPPTGLLAVIPALMAVGGFIGWKEEYGDQILQWLRTRRWL